MSWADIPSWIKMLVALAIIAGGAYLLWKVDLALGIIALSLGAGVLILTGKDSSDRRGYKF
jgi:hypothetical protein